MTGVVASAVIHSLQWNVVAIYLSDGSHCVGLQRSNDMSDSNKTVLYIDDNPRDIELLQMALDEAEGGTLAYTGMTDPHAGINAIMDESGAKPSLVIIDLNMPRLNGMQFLEKMRDCLPCRDVRIVVLTTSSRAVDHQRCLALGAVAVITKPSSFSGLLDVARSIKKLC